MLSNGAVLGRYDFSDLRPGHSRPAPARVVTPVLVKPWGQRVGYLRDFNGVLVEIGTPLDDHARQVGLNERGALLAPPVGAPALVVQDDPAAVP